MINQLVASNLSNISAHIGLVNYTVENKAKTICTLHYHDEVEFLYVHDGEFVCIVNDKDYKGTKGDVIFINSRIPHYTRSDVDGTYDSMLQYSTFSLEENILGISRYLSRFINLSKEPVVIFKNGKPETEELKKYLDIIFEEYSKKSFSYELYIKAALFQINAFLSRYDYLADSSLFFKKKNISRILPALEYIDKNYDSLITLEEISRIANLDPYYFCRLFKKTTNSTFTEYLNFVRVSKSEKKLSETDETISEIAYSLGFSSVSYFNRIFKKYKGCTPTQYKKSKYCMQ